VVAGYVPHASGLDTPGRSVGQWWPATYPTLPVWTRRGVALASGGRLRTPRFRSGHAGALRWPVVAGCVPHAAGPPRTRTGRSC